ncbi:MAG: hypothetical protein OEV86_15160 [Candidatus Krumholzibacteria bacterium]|nr:hypothetical protein [Candidatus Krumholzibacteria bacterium]
MSDAIRYDHDDPEARRSLLRFDTFTMDENDDHGTVYDIKRNGALTLRLSDDEAIALYEQLRATWAGYLAERDEAQRAVRAGVPLDQYLDGWKADTLGAFCTGYMDDAGRLMHDGDTCPVHEAGDPDESFGAYVDSGAADLARDQERGK